MQPSTIGYYHQRRWNVLSRICGHNVPMCEWCGKLLHVDIDELHVHHVNQEDSAGHSEGGWQHLLKLEEDLEKGIKMEVLCFSCHGWIHDQVIWNPKLEVPV